MLFLVLAAFAVPTSSAPPASPPPATQPRKPDAATVDEAIRLLDAQGFEGNAIHSSEVALEAMLAAMVEGLQKTSGDKLPQDFVDQLKQVMRDHATATMRANLPQMKRQAAEIYAQEFTREELVHLRELSADPVLAKARERGKVMEPKLMMIGINVMRSAQPELDAKIKRLIGDYLAAHGKAEAPDS